MRPGNVPLRQNLADENWWHFDGWVRVPDLTKEASI
jgi:hypothetical protein